MYKHCVNIIITPDNNSEIAQRPGIILLNFSSIFSVKDVQGGIPKSDLLDVNVALIHVAEQRFLAVWNGLNQWR